ncbi:hypothetical protein C8J29_101381 [Cereibacter johrii]|uniref:Uncharacterized protein n=1 Tax=Cereibacter johrii TaxID=445629 RepID=A0ABX5JEC3_9RHOB|nr:hypothetical protein C8J29_101381 [Cereibacter johrii]
MARPSLVRVATEAARKQKVERDALPRLYDRNRAAKQPLSSDRPLIPSRRQADGRASTPSRPSRGTLVQPLRPGGRGSLRHRLLPRGALPWGEGQRRIGAADVAPSRKAQEHVELWPPAIPAPGAACSTTTDRRLPPRPGSRRRLPAPGVAAMVGPRGARHHPATHAARQPKVRAGAPTAPSLPGSSDEGREPEALGRVPLQDHRREEHREAMRTDLAIGRARGAPIVAASGPGCGDIGSGRRGAPRHPVLLSGGPR